ncbi:CubicO group peptidase, beta-lactamase class C family [Paenibacillus sp. 1_12]|uniref:serine hydrolase domain-containing protein n=1 Tax=Paenibacillus sp. 1_12 TaxID=1566278 RepID=UPI0008E78052|nr:serine hydrolase [Paenibacillus sp. 1_12]SFL58527.1 CubicO group peptidase, beta-lactamase class C family [Paenibacillus sp. 1_12]
MTQSNLLPRCLPESVGISSSAVSAFLEAADSGDHGLHSFMLMRHGKVAAEAWWSPYGPDRPHMMFSLSKSFTSTAVGLAVSEGLLSVDDDVVSFFSEKNPIDDANLSKMRVRHLLSMSTGHEKDTTNSLRERKDGDWIQAFLELPVEQNPGTHFVYNSGASFMLSAIVQKVTGQTTHEYLQPRLFEPLGITGTTWETCPRGMSVGGWGLTLKTEDIIRFGQLYLQKGQWNGQQILPESWVDEATCFHVSNAGTSENIDWQQGYGYQFWRCQHNAYRGDGAFGQFCILLPEHNAVVAMTSGTRNMQNVLNLVWEHLLPAMSNGSLPADERAQADLADKAGVVAYSPLSSDIRSPLSEQVSGSRYGFPENELNIQGVAFDFNADECVVTLWHEQGQTQVRCGLGYWVEMDTNPTRQPSRIVASGKWQSDDTFVMNWRYVETPYSETMTCKFEDDKLKVLIDPYVKFNKMKEPIVLESNKMDSTLEI